MNIHQPFHPDRDPSSVMSDSGAFGTETDYSSPYDTDSQTHLDTSNPYDVDPYSHHHSYNHYHTDSQTHLDTSNPNEQ